MLSAAAGSAQAQDHTDRDMPKTALGHTTLVLAGCVGVSRDQDCLGHSFPNVSRRSDQYGDGRYLNSADNVVYSVRL